MSTLNGTASNTSWNVFIQSTVAIPFYVLFILLPSLFLNGSIVLAFIKKKYVRTPLNLLTVNQCCAGIFSNLLNGSLLLIATPVALKHGSCATAPLVVASVIWTHYGMNMLNLTAISLGMFITLKYGASFITYKKALSVILINWIYPTFWGAILAFITRDYPNLTCEAYTDYQRPPPNSTAGPQMYQIILFVARDILVSWVTRVLVAASSIASYRLFRRNTICPPEGLTRKMLLLPILMTLFLTVITMCTGILLIGLNNGYGITISVDSPLVNIKDIVLMLVEYDAIAYASLLLYFNIKLRSAVKEVLKDIFNLCNYKKNKVQPLGCQTTSKHKPNTATVRA